MPEDPTGTPDEASEARLVLRLALRGLAFAALSGVAWHWPAEAGLLVALKGLATATLAYAALLPLLVAAAGIRNMLGRRVGLPDYRRAVWLAGFPILGGLLVAAALVFRATRLLFGA